MNIKNKRLKTIGLLTLIVLLGSCARPDDLAPPCPDYGKLCSQALINL